MIINTAENKILTADPIMNDWLNRADADISNAKIAKIAKKVDSIQNKTGATIGAIDREIENSKQRESQLKRKSEDARKDDIDAYLDTRAELDKVRENIVMLQEKRDAVLDAEVPESEYRDMLISCLSEYDADRDKRRAEIIKHLTAAYQLIDEQYNQGKAVNKVLGKMQRVISSTQQKAIADSCKTTHRTFYGNAITTEESINLVRYTHSLRNIIKNYK